jgi:hypothetical protein
MPLDRAHRASAGEHGVAVDGHSRIRAAHYQRAGGLPWWRRLMANAPLTTLAATDLLVPPLPRNKGAPSDLLGHRLLSSARLGSAVPVVTCTEWSCC